MMLLLSVASRSCCSPPPCTCRGACLLHTPGSAAPRVLAANIQQRAVATHQTSSHAERGEQKQSPPCIIACAPYVGQQRPQNETLIANTMLSLLQGHHAVSSHSSSYTCCCTAVLTPRFLGGLAPSPAAGTFFLTSFFFCCSLCNLHNVHKVAAGSTQ
jgi:hypothetical protein